MKIHTNLTAADLRAALDASGIQNASLLMQEKRSRSHARRFDVYFDAEPMKGRRQSQHYHDGMPVIGATYDEWGLLINQIYLKDPTARVGPYKSGGHFHDVTEYRFSIPDGLHQISVAAVGPDGGGQDGLEEYFEVTGPTWLVLRYSGDGGEGSLSLTGHDEEPSLEPAR